MREIIFRAKRKDNGEWIEGIPIKNKLGVFMCYEENPHYCSQYYYMEIQDIAEVIPETIGQYTGSTDKNGAKIFEGDICHFYGGEYYSGFWETDYTCEIKFCHECLWYLENAEYVKVIGNIFDNPEFLKGGCL